MSKCVIIVPRFGDDGPGCSPNPSQAINEHHDVHHNTCGSSSGKQGMHHSGCFWKIKGCQCETLWGLQVYRPSGFILRETWSPAPGAEGSPRASSSIPHTIAVIFQLKLLVSFNLRLLWWWIVQLLVLLSLLPSSSGCSCCYKASSV